MAGPPLEFTYRTYILPKDSPSFPFIVGKYAALSALALTTDPNSFGIHYSTDGAFSAAEHVARLSRPIVNIFVVVAHPGDLPESQMDIEKGAWVGMVSQIGPTTKEEYWLPESGCPEPLSDLVETRFHHTGTWIDHAHRGKGLSKILIKAALDWAESTSFARENIEQVRFRAIMGPTNDLSMSLYGKFGFVRCGKSSINEAMKANGNEGIPFQGKTDWPVEFLSGRGGVIVERIVRKSDLQ
ncbi:GNAT family acetyltransferase [Venturia nashicola]|nr:GNAT family acetyltransferase [Venturia nashicola]